MDFFNLGPNPEPNRPFQIFGTRIRDEHIPYDFNEPIERDEPIQRRDDLYLQDISFYNAPTQTASLTGLKEYFSTPFEPPSLPIKNYKELIIDTVKHNMVTIITAPTGSGKSTQVPQYIMDNEYFIEKRHFKIVVTQPRRVAAISLASRVLSERNLRPIVISEDNTSGSLVGYQVGMDHRVNADTRLTYMTTGVLLRKIIHAENLSDFTHIILDEVHERDKDTDFLLLMIKRLICKYPHRVRIIVMSATVDAKTFSEYFMTLRYSEMIPAPVISIEEQMFRVKEFYLDEIVNHISGFDRGLAEFELDDEPHISDNTYEVAKRLIASFHDIELIEPHNDTKESGSVLVFLPGIYEIEHMQSMLDDENYKIIVLHSSVPRGAQMSAFAPPPTGKRKVILSTNIAESSITVPDVKYVVDFCLTKNLYSDSGSGLSSLRYSWAAKSSLDQRKGRAGRVAEGHCYRLIPRSRLSAINEFTTPEMQRCSVEQLILFCKIIGINDPSNVLCYALDPPQVSKLEEGALLLLQVGGLALPNNHIDDPLTQELTFMGRLMATLPLDVRLSRLIMFGLVFNCLGEAIVMAACLSLPAFLEIPYNDKEEKLEAYVKRMRKANGTFSDPIMMLNVYQEWYKYYAKGDREVRTFCKENFINHNRIQEVASLIWDILKSLANVNFPEVKREGLQRVSGNDEQKIFMLKLAIAAANYPYYFLMNKGIIDKQTCLKTFGDRDPAETVMYDNYEPEHCSDPDYSYLPQVRKYFRSDLFDPVKKLESLSSKLFVTFDKPSAATVAKSVYYALKCRSVRSKLSLSSGVDTQRPKSAYEPYRFANREQVIVAITHFETLNKFFCQIKDSNIRQNFDDVEERLTIESGFKPKRYSGKVPELTFGLSYYEGDYNRLYRVKVVESLENFRLKVYYLDYGNHQIINANCFFEIPDEFLECPFQAVQLSMDGISPSNRNLYMSSRQKWDARFNNEMCNQINLQHFECNFIYRIDHVYYVDLINRDKVSLRDYLLEHKIDYVTVSEADFRVDFAKLSFNNVVDIELETIKFPDPNEIVSRRPSKRFYLSGPRSPYEANYEGLTPNYSQHLAKIDTNSVNCITICSNPQDFIHELLTCTSIALSGKGCTISLRGTTKHVYTKGLAELMVLLFSPKVQLQTDASRLHYVGCVAGIGCDSDFEALWPDHDLHLAFQQRFLASDIQEVNYVRDLMSSIICSDRDNANKLHFVPSKIEKTQYKIQEHIMGILQHLHYRDPLLLMESAKAEFGWQPNCGSYNVTLEQNRSDNFLQPHSLLAIEHGYRQIFIESQDMKIRVKELQKLMYEVTENTDVKSGITLECDLCDLTFSKFSRLKTHLLSDSHLSEHRKLEHWKWLKKKFKDVELYGLKN